VDGKTRATLSFSGGLTEYGSLKNDNYQLTVRGASVHDATTGAALDGDGDGSVGGDRVFGAQQADKFFRDAVGRGSRRSDRPGAQFDYGCTGALWHRAAFGPHRQPMGLRTAISVSWFSVKWKKDF
jgi:hypothetical protein